VTSGRTTRFATVIIKMEELGLQLHFSLEADVFQPVTGSFK